MKRKLHVLVICLAFTGCVGVRYDQNPSDGGKPGWHWFLTSPSKRTNP